MTIQEFPTDKRANSLIFYLSKFQKQIRFFDLVRAPTVSCDPDFVKQKAKRTVRKEVRVLNNSRFDTEFLDGYDPAKYKSMVDKIVVKMISNTDFEQSLSQDYRDKVHVLHINEEGCFPHEQGVKYYHLLSGFGEDPILGYKFDTISDPIVSLSHLEISPDLYKFRDDPGVVSHGPLEDLDEYAVYKLRIMEMNIIGT